MNSSWLFLSFNFNQNPWLIKYKLKGTNIKLAHDDLKMWKCISDVVEEIKVTEQSAWWFGVSLISALNSYKEVVWLARERRGNNWSCSERWLVRLSWRSSGWTEMNPVWDENWRGNWRGSCSRTNVALLLLSTMPESPSISNTRVPQLRRVNSQTWPPSTLLSPGASGGEAYLMVVFGVGRGGIYPALELLDWTPESLGY